MAAKPLVPLNLRVPPKLKRDFKVWCAQRETEMTACIIEWIGMAMAGKLPPVKKDVPSAKSAKRGSPRPRK